MMLVQFACLVLAVVVVLTCAERLRMIRWSTHRWRVVGQPLAFLLWALAVGWEAGFGRAAWYELVGLGGICLWIVTTHATWKDGPPEHTRTRPGDLETL